MPDRIHCPYCGGSDFEAVDVKRRPDQRVDRCKACGGHSLVKIPTGRRYALDRADDPKSAPHT